MLTRSLIFDSLMYAAQGGHVEVVKKLLDAGADVNAQSEGSTALKLASDKGRESVVNVLRAAGAIDQRPQPQVSSLLVDAVCW